LEILLTLSVACASVLPNADQDKKKVVSIARGIIDSKTEVRGIKVNSVEIRELCIPKVLHNAMSRQAQAERERRARVTLATVEFEAAQKMIEAANLYEKSHEALRLRWMNILYEIGQQSSTNTIMLVPSSMPEAGWPARAIGKKETRQQTKE
jgi:regulator of protease activity HflC (stomatin/prohibitin superfamily)